MVGGLGQLPVGLDHERHAGGLDRDLDLVEPDLVEVGQLLLGRLDHGLGGDLAAVLLVQPLVERAAVDADADRHAPVLGLAGDELDVLGPLDVAGVEPQAVHAGLEGGERHPVVVVDVGHDRHRRAGHDVGQPGGGIGVVAGAAHDVGPGAVRGRRSAGACPRRRPSWWWSSTAPRPGRRRPPPPGWWGGPGRSGGSGAAWPARSSRRPSVADRVGDVEVQASRRTAGPAATTTT